MPVLSYFEFADTGAVLTFGWGLYGQVSFPIWIHAACGSLCPLSSSKLL